MRISRDVIDTIRDRVDIVQVVGSVVTLKKKGSSLMGLCPFHQEKSPSFSVVAHKGIFHCFGCGESGDAFAFLMKTRGVPFADAVRELGAAVGIEVEEEAASADEIKRRKARATLYDVCEAAAGYFRARLETGSEGEVARRYLAERGVSPETIRTFGLGFAPDRWDGLLNWLHKEGFDPERAVQAGLARWRDPGDVRRGAYDLFRGRIIVPVEDDRGRLVAFGGRILPAFEKAGDRDPPPKYVNSPETDIYKKSQVLYALSRARAAIQRRDRVLVVEGYFDVIALHQAGFAEAVATCGTALTASHLETIRRLTGRVVVQFDADDAGQNAAAKSLPMFLEAGIEPVRIDLGDAKDPDEFVQKHGADGFEQALQRAEPLFELVLRRSVERHGVTPGGKDKTLRDLAPLLRILPETSRPVAIERVASVLMLRDDDVARVVGKGRKDATSVAPGPARRGWTGTPELRHLFWMLIHHRDRVAPILMEADPAALTDRPSARQAMGLLLMGRALGAVIEEVGDPEVARVLTAASARTDLYTAEQVEPAARQILSRYRLQEVEGELSRLAAQISTCDPAADTALYFELMRVRQELQRKRSSILRGAQSR